MLSIVNNKYVSFCHSTPISSLEYFFIGGMYCVMIEIKSVIYTCTCYRNDTIRLKTLSITDFHQNCFFPTVLTVCPAKTYSKNCAQTCPNCGPPSFGCDVLSGKCKTGCTDGYQGPWCNKREIPNLEVNSEYTCLS